MSEGTADRQLRERAGAVIPGGMYGHQAAPGAAYPQFMRGGRGARIGRRIGREPRAAEPRTRRIRERAFARDTVDHDVENEPQPVPLAQLLQILHREGKLALPDAVGRALEVRKVIA